MTKHTNTDEESLTEQFTIAEEKNIPITSESVNQEISKKFHESNHDLTSSGEKGEIKVTLTDKKICPDNSKGTKSMCDLYNLEAFVKNNEKELKIDLGIELYQMEKI